MEALLAYPLLIKFILGVGSFRLVFKPIFAAVEKYVLDTPSKEDDAKLAAIEASAPYRVFAFLLDYLGSIKLDPKK